MKPAKAASELVSEQCLEFTMSLALIQGYSSAEEEEEAQTHLDNDDQLHSHTSSDDDDGDFDQASAAFNRSIRDRSLFDLPQPNSSGLPSAFDAFSEVDFICSNSLSLMYISTWCLAAENLEEKKKNLRVVVFWWINGGFRAA